MLLEEVKQFVLHLHRFLLKLERLCSLFR